MIKLTNCTISAPIDRIRGTESIAVTVNCTFSSGQTVPGVALCSKPEELQATVQLAIENARENLETLSPGGSKVNEKLGNLIREILSTKTQMELKRTSRTDAEKMLQPADENLQNKITGLCEALGIDIIKVQDEWSNVEVLLLIKSFEKMTEPLSGDVI